MANQPKQLVLKSITQLFNYDFFIPAYQRGYRWTEMQVTQLLSDIWEFTKRDKKENGEFYCLQPVVVKKQTDGRWEVIDGQQRLTTLYLILKYLEDICKLLVQDFSIYSIQYSTRKDSAIFLDSIKDDNSGYEKNIDFYFMKRAYVTIAAWFENKDNNVNKLDFINTLIKHRIEGNKEEIIDVENNVRVIWYEIEESGNNNSIDIFTRLNIGKIPLTNAELIKALFLQKGNFAEEKASLRQLQIASEWDSIEKTLQDDAFWFFIYNTGNPVRYDNRIEYIFDLMKGRTKESEFHHTFNEFYKDFASCQKAGKPDIDKIWIEIKKYFLTFEEWFKDNELFHYIGYLIDCGLSVNAIKKEAANTPKDDFKNNYLIGEIKRQVNCDLDSIGYEDKLVSRILLLFNIQTILETQKSDMRFPFHKYKSESWDIEHVCSQTDKTIHANKRAEWIDDMLDFFVGCKEVALAEEYLSEIKSNRIEEQDAEVESILESLIELKRTDKIEEERFNYCFELIRKHFKENNQKEDRNDISNLALLDAATNRSYGNSFFPIKRKRIIENDANGIFVPIATKNLFLKYYSKRMSDVMYWSNYDADDYLNAIKNTLKIFLPKNNK